LVERGHGAAFQGGLICRHYMRLGGMNGWDRIWTARVDGRREHENA
jgi:hypothetical protein